MAEHISLPNGFRLLPLEVCESTNEKAKQMAREGAPSGVVVWARRQTGGRGRWGRGWESPRGNLYVSFLLRPVESAGVALQLGFAISLAAADTVAECLGAQALVNLKWPNDVLVNGRKVAGILLESEAHETGLSWLVIGVGLNVAKAPETARWPATSLRTCGSKVRVETVLETLARWFVYWRGRLADDGFEALREAWEARGYAIGECVTVGQGESTVTGTALGLDPAGGLRLRTASGETVVSYGDMFPPERPEA